MDNSKDGASTLPTQQAYPNSQQPAQHKNQTQSINLVSKAGPSSFLTRYPTRARLVGKSMQTDPENLEVINLGPDPAPKPSLIPFLSQLATQESINLVSGTGSVPFSPSFPVVNTAGFNLVSNARPSRS